MKTTLGVRPFALALSLLALSSIAPAVFAADSEAPQMRSGWNFSDLGRTPVHSGGRLKPLETLAMESMLFTTGSRSFKSMKPVEFMISVAALPEAWESFDWIQIQNKELKRQVGLDEAQSRFSPKRLMEDSYLRQYAMRLSEPKAQTVPNLSGGAPKEDPREKELKRSLERLGLYQSLVSGQAFGLVPTHSPNPWKSVVEADAKVGHEKDIQISFLKVLKAYREGDQTTFEAESLNLKSLVESSAQGFTDSDRSKIVFETLYNRSQPFQWGWIFLLIAALLWTTAVVVGNTLSLKNEDKLPASQRRLRLVAGASTAFGMLALVSGITLRCLIAGRPPVTNMYESVIWVCFGVMLFALILFRIQKQAVLLAIATALSAFGLIISDSAPAVMDPSIHPLVPVLRSNLWLTIHVLTITLGYAAFALSMGIGNVTLWQFFRKAPVTKTMALNQLTYRAMQFGVVLLAAGTILGGVWADYSWGRFWGWDPKEVWALIALLGYLTILHARYAGYVGQFGFAAWSVTSFMLVVMAWYGVNFVLGVGLHSYGFSTGGRGTMALFSVVQLGYVVLVTLRHKGLLKVKILT